MFEPKPLILIPGLLCDREVWSHQSAYLDEVAKPILVPDLSDCSTPIEMVDAVLEIAPSQFNLAGHSMGGWVALELMKVIPERVRKLCLLSTTADVDTELKQQARKDLIARTEKGDFQSVMENLIKIFVHREEIRQPFKEMILRNQDAFVNQMQAMMARESSLELLERISVPTLVILGEQDIDFPGETRLIAEIIPSAKLATIENCGHMSPMEQPEAVTSLMRFWIEHM